VNNSKLPFVFVIVCAGVLLMMVLGIIAVVGAMNITDGCLYRYSMNDDLTLSSSDQLSSTVTLKATANYTALSSDGSGGVELDPNAYGQWLNTNVRVTEGQKIKYNIKGEVSLCKAYLLTNNLQQSSNQDSNGNVIEIPRTEDQSATPVTLYLSAKTGSWRNLTELFQNDHVVVSILPDQKTTAATVSVYNTFEGTKTADCREGSKTYDPICGRFSLWSSSSTYVSTCQQETYDCSCKRKCTGTKVNGNCVGGSWVDKCDTCIRYISVSGTAPESYKNDGTYTSSWKDNTSDLITNFNQDCSTNYSYIMGDYQKEKYFWFSADNAAGLLYRESTSSSASTSLGSGYEFAQIQSDQSFYTQGENYKIILNQIQSDIGVKYLQYRLYDNGSYSNNTGGYVLNIKHTKCRRSNGNAFNDTVSGRGVVQYVIADYGNNPNTTTPTSVENIPVDQNGDGEIIAASGADGYLWLKINNAATDYKDSTGEYTVQFYTSVARGWFDDLVLEPFFNGLKSKIKDTATTIFKNMTCYKGLGDSVDECRSFFTYIKAMLILYIILYGMMFLMGMVKITQTDLVIRVIKIGIVAGLMNDRTFEFFNTYVFDFVTGFSDEIVANMSGYSMFSGNTEISNPFVFLREVMTKIFLSSTFAAQIMALLSMGFNGIFYFIIVFLCLCIVVVVTFKAIAVYMMAFMAITVLIGIAPLFLTFILFERTWYLFDNWVKFTIRYMLEPVIVLAGIIILTQLFTIYLDYVIGYSVCWKCALAFKLPFPQIEGITPAFLDVPIFCLYWFAPWGFDSSSGEMGLNMQNFVVLLMIAYCMWGYIDFAHKLVARLAGGSGGPSAVRMGNKMSRVLGGKALSKLGLDARSRANMIEGIRSMRASMRTGKKINPGEAYNRHDGGKAAQSGAGGVGSDSGTPRSNLSSKLSQVGQFASQAKDTMAAVKKSWGSILPSKKADAQSKETTEGTTDASKADNAKVQNKSSRRSNLFGVSQLLGAGKKQKDEEASADKDQKAAVSSDADAKKDSKVARSDADTKVDAKDSGAAVTSQADAKKDSKATKSEADAKDAKKGVIEKAVKQDATGADDSGSAVDANNTKADQVKRSDSTIDDKVQAKEELKAEEKTEQTQADKKTAVSDEQLRDEKVKADDVAGDSSVLSRDDSESAKVKRSGGETVEGLEQKERRVENKDLDSEDKGASRETRNRVESRDFSPENLQSEKKSDDDSGDQQTKGKKGSKE
jgi:type IV secretion system protein VirB6